MNGFSNLAGKADCDQQVASELECAGIGVESHEFLRPREEVKTAVRGTLHGWLFTRAWCYWVAKGPGIQLDHATALHKEHGQTVRVAGHCGCPSPLEWYGGFAVDLYHVDSAEGLQALAKTIQKIHQNGVDLVRELEEPDYHQSI